MFKINADIPTPLKIIYFMHWFIIDFILNTSITVTFDEIHSTHNIL